ncbi:MAG TPA: SPFH domain-containing protein [Anaerolineales bacterium]|nr:SPFH domain-containing protein [Anaerolineales bacterium]
MTGYFVAAGLILAGILFLLVLSGVRFIPNTRIGIVEKRFSLKGSIKSGFIALNGEAGFQPKVLRGGLHYLMPIQYVVRMAPLVTIPQGKIGYIFARDGKLLDATQTLASNAEVGDFQDVEGFLKNNGQRGPQRRILREGTYAINLMQFIVLTDERVYSLPLSREEQDVINRMAQVIAERGGFVPVIIKDTDDKIGIATVHDGPSLAQGEIIAPVVGDDSKDPETYHNKFQDPDKFLKAGGFRGRQLQVLVEGTYYVNRLFATVEMIQKTVIEVGNVGVVVSYTGDAGEDLSGIDYRHGELVARGKRGVWEETLMPGKYAFNTYAGKVVAVPTTNFILKWIRNQTGAHRFDENLSEVSLITKDAFEPSLPLSVVVHIDYKKAPLVIQRFGDIKRLVEQTLDPMVAAYFKNVGQTRTLIQLLQERSDIQQISSKEMKEKFEHYNLQLEEVLIGTPSSPEGDVQIETILTQLRSRQIAAEQIETYDRQEKAAVKERELREAESRTQMQTGMTQAELNIEIQSNQGKADYQRSIQQAAQIRALAEAEAEKVARIGIAQALATEEQVRAYGGPQFQVTQTVLNRFAEAIQQSKVDVVPRVVVGGDKESGTSSIMEGLLAMLLSDRFGALANEAQGKRSEEAEQLRSEIRKSMTGKTDKKE